MKIIINFTLKYFAQLMVILHFSNDVIDDIELTRKSLITV